MKSFKRSNAPDWLLKNWVKWGERFKQKLDNSKKKNEFTWYSYKKEKVNKLLYPILRDLTQNHCSFCDGFPLQQTGETIEHFKPKSKFPLLSYQWENLYISCHNCQQKLDEFNDSLLQPDKIDYEFSEYFIYNYASGEIKENPAKPLSNQQKAKETIRIYRLNDFGRPEDRKRVFKQFNDSNNPVIDDFAYRFML